ncbi:hypothetical protein [Pseudomonas sp. zfem005]|uniref:hypothetical protein n=1 Tax=Pseudomonas sp. zfem005 TaxID=3078200 RepID=UPI002928D2A2|nr:hypothetical protein [Pseudomonas sp. zfem005]MDU9414276.1 hypothetical protein [Pseudomonas sp. zfem005]
MNRLRIALACAALLGSALTPTLASADVGFGVGLSYVFGNGGGLSVGVKAFSNDEDNETVGSLGLDYLVQSGAFRPNIGVAYQGEGYFSGADVGYNLDSQSVDFGLGGGWSNSDDDHKTPAPAPAPILI